MSKVVVPQRPAPGGLILPRTPAPGAGAEGRHRSTVADTGWSELVANSINFKHCFHALIIDILDFWFD